MKDIYKWLDGISKKHKRVFEAMIASDKIENCESDGKFIYTYTVKKLSYCHYYCLVEGVILKPPTIKRECGCVLLKKKDKQITKWLQFN